jgi:hypothetical protein
MSPFSFFLGGCGFISLPYVVVPTLSAGLSYQQEQILMQTAKHTISSGDSL